MRQRPSSYCNAACVAKTISINQSNMVTDESYDTVMVAQPQGVPRAARHWRPLHVKTCKGDETADLKLTRPCFLVAVHHNRPHILPRYPFSGNLMVVHKLPQSSRLGSKFKQRLRPRHYQIRVSIRYVSPFIQSPGFQYPYTQGRFANDRAASSRLRDGCARYRDVCLASVV
jgi:hypothetical protein